MALKQNIIYIYFKGKHQVTSKSQYQYNRKQYLYFADLNLPQVFEVHFSNRDKGESKTQIGNDKLVEIPDEYFWNGALQIYAWIYLHSGADDSETIYEIRIPLTKRAKPTDEEPLPVQQSAIDKAIAELNNAVNVTTENVNKTESDKIIVANIKDEVVDLKEDIDSTAATVNQKAQDAIDASGRAEASALNAADSERKALNYSQQAEQSAQEALESKNIAKQKAEIATGASAEALGYRDETVSARDIAVQAKQNIVDYRDETKGYRDETLNTKNDIQTLKGQIDETAEEIKDISDTVKEDAQSASQAANSANQSSINASESASQARQFADGAEESANQAEQNKNQTETFKNQSEEYKTQSETFKNQAETFKNQAEQFKNQTKTNVTHYPKIIGEYWYVWDATNEEYINTNVDANGIKGDTGNGIASVALNDDYTLTITFTDDTTYTTPSIRGQQGEKGDTGRTGESGVYIGTEEPKNEDVKVWIDTDESADSGTVEDLIADITDLKEDLNAIQTATASDVGKALKAKTVTDGKVVEWEFGETGVAVDPTLSIEGKAADAKATGDGIRALSDLNPNGEDVPITIENGWWGNVKIGGTITAKNDNNRRRAHVDLTQYIGYELTLQIDFTSVITASGASSYLCDSNGIVTDKRTELQMYTDNALTVTVTENNCHVYLAYTAAKASGASVNVVSPVAKNIQDIDKIKADVADAVKTVSLTNLCENGNIEDTTGFTINSASVVAITASDNELTIAPLARNAEVFYAVPTAIVAGHKYYIGADIKTAENMQNTFIRLQQYAPSTVNLSSVSYDLLNAGTWQRLSIAYTSGFETSAGTLRFNLKNTTASAWANIYLRRIVIIDLTEAFGEGNEPDTGTIDAIIAKYAENSFFDGQLKTNGITQEVYSADAHKEPIYVGVSGHVINVNAKYSADKDISYTIGKTGSNSIFNFRYPSFINNVSMSVSSKVNLSQVIPIETDWLSPEKLKVPSESADGDMPNSDNFTGGNHAYNGDSSGSATAETSAYSFYVDGRKVTEFAGYAHYADVYWTNLVQATNTKKADGTGRAVMQEDFHAHFDGVKWTIDARFTALEALASWSLYGIACRRGSTWNGQILYHDSPNNRAWNGGSANSNAGGNTCKSVTIRKDSDYFDMGVESDGLGDMAMCSGNSFFSSNDKTYSNLVVSARDISANSVYTYKGFYRFYSVA